MPKETYKPMAFSESEPEMEQGADAGETAGAETPEAAAEAPSYREVGAARFQGVGKKIQGWKSNFGSMMKTWGEKRARFGENAKKAGMEGVYLVMSADKWAKDGMESAGKAVAAGYEGVEDGIVRASSAIGSRIESIGPAIEKGLSIGEDAANAWLAARGEQMKEIGQNVTEATSAWATKTGEQAAAFGERVAAGTQEALDTAGMLGEGLKNMSQEALASAAQTLENARENVAQFGREAMEVGAFKWRELKNKFNEGLGKIRARLAEARFSQLEKQGNSIEAQKLKLIQGGLVQKDRLAANVREVFAQAA